MGASLVQKSSHVEDKTKLKMTRNMQNAKGATHVSLALAAEECARPAPSSVRLTSAKLPRDATSLGILLESSAHCPDRRNLFLCLVLLSQTRAPWPSGVPDFFQLTAWCSSSHDHDMQHGTRMKRIAAKSGVAANTSSCLRAPLT